MRRSGVEHLLHAVHVAGEAGHDDPLLRGPEDLGQHGRDLPLAGHDAGNLGIGGIRHQQVNALGANPREPAKIGQPAVERQLVHLEVAGVQDHPGAGADTDRERIGDGVIDREKFKVKGPERIPGACCHLLGDWRDAVLSELATDEAKRQLRADQRDVLALAEEVRHPADVVLVRMREDDRLDLVQPVLDRGEVRQDQVNPGLIRLGEEHAAVHDEQAPGALKDRHVAADLAEPAQRDDAQAVRFERRRGPELGMRVAHRSFTPPASRSVRSCCISAGVASASGARTGPPGRPSMLSAAFVVMTFWVRVMPMYTGSRPRWMSSAPATSPLR